jgi:hypothetical protein
MTTWADVAEKAITIGLPLLFAGAVTIYAANRQRRYEGRVEQRRRAWELLEQFVRALHRFDTAFDEHVLDKREAIYRPETLTTEDRKRHGETLHDLDKALGDFEEYYSLLDLFGFEQPAQHLVAYVTANKKLRQLLRDMPPPEEKEVEEARLEAGRARMKLVHALHRTYKKT